MGGTFLINGQTPESLGISLATFTRVSLAPDILNITVTDASIAASQSFVNKQPIVVTRDGVGFFKGSVSRRMRKGGPQSVITGYEVKGPWRALERRTITQSWPGNPSTPRVIIGAIPENDATYLYEPEDSGLGTLDTWSSIQIALQYAISNGDNFQLGTIFTGQYLWPMPMQSAKVAAVLKALLQFHPKVVSFFDYTTTPPTLHFRQKDDVNPAYDLTPVTFSAQANGGEAVRATEVEPRDDLLVPSVVIRFVDEFGIPSAVDKAPNEAVTGLEPDAILADIQYSGGEWMAPGSSQDDLLKQASAIYPAGLAQWLYNQMQPLHYQGTHTRIEQEPGSTGCLIGGALNLTDGLPAWATMNAIIQQQSTDLQTGVMTLTFGLANQLGLTDWGHFKDLCGGGGCRVKSQQEVAPEEEVTEPQPREALVLTLLPPAGYEAPEPEGDEEPPTLFWLTPGTGGAAGRMFPFEDFLSGFTLSPNKYLFGKVSLTTGDTMRALAFDIVTGASPTAFQTEEYDATSHARPSAYYVLLGGVDGTGTLVNYGTGSVVVVEHVTDISRESGQSTRVVRNLSHHRKG